MQVEVKVFRKEGTYKNNEGKEKRFTNFSLGINGYMIPIEVKYFPNPNNNNRDAGYAARVSKLELVSEPLPEVEKKPSEG